MIYLFAAIAIAGCAVTDARLSGKWRSNLELTTHFNENNAVLTERQKKLFSQLLGRMEISYLSPGKCEIFLPRRKIDTGKKIIEFDESKEIVEYKVVYRNENTIVIAYVDSLFGKTVRTLNYIGDMTYWIYVGDFGFFDIHVREYFTKVE